MQFEKVIGQKEVKQHLVEMVQQNRLSHALLFLGKEGSGVLSLALAFAQFVTCTTRSGKNNAPKAEAAPSMFGDPEPVAAATSGPDALLHDSCGTCPACFKAQKLMHPDIHYSYPVIPKKSGDKPTSSDYATEWREFVGTSPYGNSFDWLQHIGAENKQGNITSEECNDIIRKLSLKSFESEYKILVMWMPEYLGKEGNKLLKLIEEPPPNTLFVLAAENEEQILPTILSRCQLVKVPLLETADIEQALIEKSNAPAQTARQTAGIAEGNYREALQLLQHAGDDWQSLLRDWLNAALKGGPQAQVKWIEDISKQGREKQKQFLRYFNHLLEQSIRIRVMGADRILLPDQEKDFAQRLNKIASVSQQQILIEELDKAAYYVERNANAKMLFHALTIKLYHIIQDKALFLTE